MPTPSPLVQVSDNGGPYNPTGLTGLDITAGHTVSIQLQSSSGVGNWYLQVGLVTISGGVPVVTAGTGTDENQVSPPTLTGLNASGLVTAGPTGTVTFTFPAAGSALLFSSTVTGTFGQITTTFALFSRTGQGYRVAPAGLTREGNSTYGWASIVNPAIRSIGSSGATTRPILAGSVSTFNGASSPLHAGSLLFKPGDEKSGYKVYFRVVLETTNSSYTAYVDLIDVNNVLGGGAGAEVTGSQLSTPNVVETELEIEITALEGLTAGTNVLLDCRVWIAPTATGQQATCSMAQLVIA